jgi:mRNA-degrading endonuclease toxin of MazEF toxin-antitoxin module
VEPSEGTGLDRYSFVQCELLRSVNRKRLVYRLGSIDDATSDRVWAVVETLLDH